MLRIDAHHHLWHFTQAEYGWIGDEMSALRRDFLLDELRPELAASAVEGTVAVQARQTVEETQWLLGLASGDSPILGVVGWLPLASGDFSLALRQFAGNTKLKGLRHVVQGEPAGFLDGDIFNRNVSELSEAGLVYDILIHPHQLMEATRFIDRHPDQSFVLDHIAKPDIRRGEIEIWGKHIRELARRPNICCKLSGMVTEADWTNWTPAGLRPYFDVAVGAFGADRLMIGTDWPVLTVGCTYAEWWQTVESWVAPLSEEEQAAILGETAARVYRLETAGRIRH